MTNESGPIAVNFAVSFRALAVCLDNIRGHDPSDNPQVSPCGLKVA